MKPEADPSDTASNDSSNNRAVSSRSGGIGRGTFYALVAVIVALLITVGVLAGLLAKANKDDDKGSQLDVSPVDDIDVPEDNVETVGSVTAAGRPLSMHELELILSTMAEEYGLDLPAESYQAPAFLWTLDTQESTMSERRLVQRFALACLFHATNQTITSADGTVNEPWQGTNWLADEDECTWAGITCSEELEGANAVSSIEKASASVTNKDKERRVIKISLSSKGLVGVLPGELALLQNSLQSLDLFRNSLSHSHGSGREDWLSQMTSLTHLYYGQNNFVSRNGVPSSIGALTNLVEFDCSFNSYQGALSGEPFAALSNLEYLSLSGNAFGSSVPTELSSLPNLKFLYLQDDALTGDLSFMTVMDETKMVEFWMDHNPGVSGEIPSEVGLITTLQSWSITNCSLTGTLPTELSNLPLKQFWCDPNEITGPSVMSIEGVELVCGAE